MKKTLIIISVAALVFLIVAALMVAVLVKEFAQQKQNRRTAQNSNGNSIQTQTTENDLSVTGTSRQDAVVGLWGGKWDGQWPVFLLIRPNTEPNTYKIRYRWLENSNNVRLSIQNFIGHKTNNYVQAGLLTFRMTGTNGMLYGAFKTPRMANLVRLEPSPRPTSANAGELLQKHGWSTNAIPPDEALKKITEEPGD